MTTSPDFQSGYDAAMAAHKHVVDALEAQNAELRAEVERLTAPPRWWNVTICQPHVGEPWVWEPR